MSEDKIRTLTPEPRGTRKRTGLLVGAAAAALVILVGVTLTLTIADGAGPFGEPSRTVALTIEGEQCTFEGPSEVPPGEIQITYHNETPGDAWVDFVMLAEGRSASDIIESFDGSPSSGGPLWTKRVWSDGAVEANTSTEPVARTVEPGVHVFVCGTWSPYQPYFGGQLTVLPS